MTGETEKWPVITSYRLILAVLQWTPGTKGLIKFTLFFLWVNFACYSACFILFIFAWIEIHEHQGICSKLYSVNICYVNTVQRTKRIKAQSQAKNKWKKDFLWKIFNEKNIYTSYQEKIPLSENFVQNI